MKFSKNVNNKKCAPKIIFFNEKKNYEDSHNFWHRKLTLKVRILSFLTTFTQLTARRINFYRGWLFIFGLKEGLVECATLCVKSEVILTKLPTYTIMSQKEFGIIHFLNWLLNFYAKVYIGVVRNSSYSTVTILIDWHFLLSIYGIGSISTFKLFHNLLLKCKVI